MADGDEEQPKRERFNTQYLVSQIQTEQKRTKMIGLAVAGVLALILIYVLFIKEPAPPTIPGGGAPAAAAPAAPGGAAPPAPIGAAAGTAAPVGAAPAAPAPVPFGAAPPAGAKPAAPAPALPKQP